MGIYESRYFEPVEEEPEENEVILEPDTIYQADLSWRPSYYGMVERKTYYVTLNREKHVRFYEDQNLDKYRGSFPIQWFKRFKKLDAQIPPKIRVEITIDKDTATIKKKREKKDSTYEQLTLF